MGVAAGDVDGDGIVDLVVTNFSEDFTTLYHGTGKGFFEDVSEAAGVGPPTRPLLSWGVALADLDDDGDLDLVIASGHIYPQIERHPELGLRYREPLLLLENDGQGRFIDRTQDAGPAFAEPRLARGLAVGDYDDDGDLDLLLSVLDGPPVLLRNESKQGAWLEVRCVAPPGQGPVLGTQISIEVAGRRQLRDIASGDSYLSSHDPRAHFGLGTASHIDRVRVRWPDGTESVRESVAANQILTVIRDGATVLALELREPPSLSRGQVSRPDP
jgi:enediyne biosynthesis protein E4